MRNQILLKGKILNYFPQRSGQSLESLLSLLVLYHTGWPSHCNKPSKIKKKHKDKKRSETLLRTNKLIKITGDKVNV